MTQTIEKTVKLRLLGLDGNAYVLLGAWRKQARREGWTNEEIEAVSNEAMSGDYEHLVQTLMVHCNNNGA